MGKVRDRMHVSLMLPDGKQHFRGGSRPKFIVSSVPVEGHSNPEYKWLVHEGLIVGEEKRYFRSQSSTTSVAIGSHATKRVEYYVTSG